MAARYAVLLAAGLGTRLGGPKPLVRLHGRPLAWYPLSVLHLVGASEVCIVTRSELEGELRQLAESVYGSGAVHVVINSEPWRENGYSLLLASRLCPCPVGEPVYVSMSDHVYSPLVPARLAVPRWAVYSIAGDREPAYVDADEATKILAVGGVGYAVGKGLRFWSHIDMGVHAVRLDAIREASELVMAWSQGVLGLNMLTDTLARLGGLYVSEASSLPWTEVDTPRDLEEAEKGRRRRVVEHVLSWIRS
ncbi:sugar nucleotidyltransferase [Pyrodictium delaneyi]|nr:sugar nucleotidyltransferase [Pyrodictium delaneyi]